MENLITDECIETSEEKMLFHRLFGFLIPDDEQHEIMDIVSDTINDCPLIEKEGNISIEQAAPIALETMGKFDKKYVKKLLKITYREYDDLKPDSYITKIVFKKRFNKIKGCVDEIGIPQKISMTSPIWLGHEYMHALKDTEVKEYLLKDISSEVIPFFYELVMANEEFPKLKEEWKSKRLGMLSYDNEYYKEAKKRREENPDAFDKIKDANGQYLSSYYYALNLYHIYKKYPKEVLKEVNEVLKHKKNTIELLKEFDIKKSTNNTNIYILEHENL